MSRDLQVITNDALVVLCLTGPSDKMTHHGFKQRALAYGFELSTSQCHNLLHRAMGRVKYSGSPDWEWSLTAMGLAYREHVVDTLTRLRRAYALTSPP